MAYKLLRVDIEAGMICVGSSAVAVGMFVHARGEDIVKFKGPGRQLVRVCMHPCHLLYTYLIHWLALLSKNETTLQWATGNPRTDHEQQNELISEIGRRSTGRAAKVLSVVDAVVNLLPYLGWGVSFLNPPYLEVYMNNVPSTATSMPGMPETQEIGRYV